MRDKTIWAFNAGNAFAGNPKWLFLYLQEHHPEITCYWFCYRYSLVKKMRALGYRACQYRSSEAREIGAKAGVYVVEQNKEAFQPYFEGITVLNLWHGVTCKKLEHSVTGGFMEEGIVAKHIRNESVYRQQLMLVTSPQQERIFKEQCKVADENIVRAPYPRSFYRSPVSTFDHDFVGAKGLPATTKVAVYAPTFRDFDKSSFFSKALPDMPALIDKLEEHGWLLVLKTHPQMEGDFQLSALKKRYGMHPRVLFWNNDEDFYEVLDRVDMAIFDYSSIFFDLLARGVKRFVRYAFDLDGKERLRDFAADYLEVTCGSLCTDFPSLLDEFTHDGETDPAERERVFDLAWSYSRDYSIEDIVRKAMAHRVDGDVRLPVLYSYDVFDTLISRKSGRPKSVFLYVQEKMRASSLSFPAYLESRYVQARADAEASCRQYLDRTLSQRRDGRTEITFDMIFERMASTYGLDGRQVDALKNWELECELSVSEGIRARIDEALELAEAGETVLLVSDMYLPEQTVKALLAKADPRLAELPLFLSSTTGRQKTKRGLFLDAFHALDYRYSKWVHVGDNRAADKRMPEKLGIECRLVSVPKPPAYAAEVSTSIGSFDAALVSTMLARLMAGCEADEDRFACGYASLYFVPYVYWVLDDAVERGFEHLYFIARDGYHLKRIADAIIARRGLPLQTSYIYGSRKAWRVPSQIDVIDDDFFSAHGNFSGVFDYASLLDAAELDDETFARFFPQLAYLGETEGITLSERRRVVELLADSGEYRAFLLDRAEEKRGVVVNYLKQAIDFSQRFAFVEFWGRGYTQECHTRLLKRADARVSESAYYYARSICPSQEGNVRLNFTDNAAPLLFAEALFGNMPYTSVSGYRREGDAVVPVFGEQQCDRVLFEALERQLPRVAGALCDLDLVNPQATMRELFDYAVGYFNGHQADPVFLRHIAPLTDSIAMGAVASEFAPRFSVSWAKGALKHDGATTKSLRMTVARANPVARALVAWFESRRR